MKSYVIKHRWEDFHQALKGFDVFLGDSKQMKWFVFSTENDVEIGRILENDSSKYTIKKRQEWFDAYGGLPTGVIG